MKGIIIVMCAFLFSGCSTTTHLYNIMDMDDFLLDYYTNDLRRISPGISCGDFKNNKTVGCFKIIATNADGKARELVYDNLDGNVEVLHRFDPATNSVFIEKSYDTEIQSSPALPEHKKVVLKKGQPSLKVIFFEKSSLQIYWQNGVFQNIWISD